MADPAENVQPNPVKNYTTQLQYTEHSCKNASRNVDADFMGNIRGPAETILLEGVCRNIFKL